MVVQVMMRPCYRNLIILIIFLCLANAAEPQTDLVAGFMGPQNAARNAVGAGLNALVWNTTLEQYAKWYANQRKADCQQVHSGRPYGENIFWGGEGDWTPEQAVEDWVSEKQWYNYASNSCAEGQECLHYTQIVWNTTRRVGCAKVMCDNGGVFMTCNYNPPGNYIGKRPY